MTAPSTSGQQSQVMKEALNNARNFFFFFPSPYFHPASRRQNRAPTLGRLLLCGCISKRCPSGTFWQLSICQHVTSRRVLKTEGHAMKHSTLRGGCGGRVQLLARACAPSTRLASYFTCGTQQGSPGKADRKWTPLLATGLGKRLPFGGNEEEWSS